MSNKTIQTVQYVLVSLSLLALAIFGVTGLVWHNSPDSVPAASPDITQVFAQFAYDGPYMDIEAELARRTRMDDSFGISLVNAETRLAAPLSLTARNEAGEVFVQSGSVPMTWNGGTYDLVFHDDILAGYYGPDATLADRLSRKMAVESSASCTRTSDAWSRRAGI